jgi:hypothetical protein
MESLDPFRCMYVIVPCVRGLLLGAAEVFADAQHPYFFVGGTGPSVGVQ